MTHTSSSVDSNSTIDSTRRTEPRRDTRNKAYQCTTDTSPLVRLVPGDAKRDGHDSRAKRNAHEFLEIRMSLDSTTVGEVRNTHVEPSHGNADVEEDEAEETHDYGKRANHGVRNTQDLCLCCVRVDIFLASCQPPHYQGQKQETHTL